MSTYLKLNSRNNNKFDECPEIIQEYLNYLKTIRNMSDATVNGYYIDLRTFFRFLILFRSPDGIPEETEDRTINDIMREVSINYVDLAFIKTITLTEIYEFLYFCQKALKNAPASRGRKLSSVKMYFRYLHVTVQKIQEDPSLRVTSKIKQRKRLPRHLSVEESTALLQNVMSSFAVRDELIITLFLNCGLRLCELCSANVADLGEDGQGRYIKIVGKGDKERKVYLNCACQRALDAYLKERSLIPNIHVERALIVSEQTHHRLSRRRVQQIVEATLAHAGLSGKGYSTHKLRHTAATLMYQNGHVDMLTLKEFLGHENVSTTQIYTHTNDEMLRNAVDVNPLANIDSHTDFKKEK